MDYPKLVSKFKILTYSYRTKIHKKRIISNEIPNYNSIKNKYEGCISI